MAAARIGVNSANLSTNTALGTTGLDIRQVYLQFGNKSMGTFLFGRNIGLFGADVILNDMTLPGVGAPGSAAGPAPTNTTLGGIGFGYIYTDWLAQMDYTTPDFSGFNLTVGIFDPLNSLTDVRATRNRRRHRAFTPRRPTPWPSRIRPSCTGRWPSSPRSSTTRTTRRPTHQLQLHRRWRRPVRQARRRGLGGVRLRLSREGARHYGAL